MIKAHDVLLGKTLRVVTSNNKTLIGLTGKIINDTFNSFQIKVAKKSKLKKQNDEFKIKTILKNQCTFIINDVEFNGSLLIKKPCERIKQKWKRK